MLANTTQLADFKFACLRPRLPFYSNPKRTIDKTTSSGSARSELLKALTELKFIVQHAKQCIIAKINCNKTCKLCNTEKRS